MGKVINAFIGPTIKNEPILSKTETIDQFVWYLRGKNKTKKFYEKIARDISKEGISILKRNFGISPKRLHPHKSTLRSLDLVQDFLDFEEELENKFNLWLDHADYSKDSPIGDVFYTVYNTYTSYEMNIDC